MKAVVIFLLFIVLFLFLLIPVHCLTPAELGTVATIQGVQCRFCRINCLESPLFEKCDKQYYEYGCHINHYCLTTVTATAREYFAGISICIYRNGCKLRSNVTETDLLEQTNEGRLELQLKGYVSQSLSSSTSMSKLQKDVANLYASQIETIESNYSNDPFVDLLTKAKRNALKIISVSPSFFVLYDLANEMNSEKDFWEPTLLSLQEFTTIYGTAQYFENAAAKQQKIDKINSMYKICKDFENQNTTKENLINQMKQDIYKNPAKKRLVYYYMYRRICQLPKEFILASKMVDELVSDTGDFDYLSVFQYSSQPQFWYKRQVIKNDAIVATKLDPIGNQLTKLEIIFEAIQNYSCEYVKLFTEQGNQSNTTEIEIRLNALEQDLLKVAPSCPRMLCTYTCTDYVYDVTVKICDIDDEGTNIFRQVLMNSCRNFEDSASLVGPKWAAPKNEKYCNSKLRTTEMDGMLCVISALKNTTGQYQSKYTTGIISNDPNKYSEEAQWFWQKCSECLKTKAIKLPLASGLVDKAVVVPTVNSVMITMLGRIKQHSSWKLKVV